MRNPPAKAPYSRARQPAGRKWEIEIGSLDELVQLCRDNGNDLVVSTNYGIPSKLRIMIYDDYLE